MTGDKERETSEDRGSTRHSGRQTIKGKRVKRDIRRAGHHEPDWETNVGRQVKTNSRAPPASQTGRQMNVETSGEPDTTTCRNPDTS